MQGFIGRSHRAILLWIFLTAVGIPALAQDIHTAAEAGDLAQVTALLAENPQLLDAANERGLTPLHLAARRGHSDVVRLLIERGADLEQTDELGFTALLYAASSMDLDLVQYLVSNGADVTVMGQSPRMRLASTGAEVVEQEGQGISAADVAFQHEVQQGGSALTQYLIDKGAAFDPNALVMRGLGKLDFAVPHGNVDMVRLLVELGVDPNAPSAYPLSPLFNACLMGHIEIVETLLGAGADVDAPSYEGNVPIAAATTRGHADVVRLLLDHGARSDFVQESTGRNLLHLAVLSGSLEIVDQLLSRGVALDEPDNDGRTSLYYAGRYGHRSVYDRLIEHGASASDDVETRFGRSLHLERTLTDGEAIAWYLNHRGWAIKTSKHFLVFDAEEFGVTRPTDPVLANGFLTPAEIGGQNLVALYSAYHGEIGEHAYIHEIEDSLASVTYVHNAGDRWRGSDATVYLSPRDQTSVGDIEVVTVPVTETMTSLGYLVKVDGLVVYYAGFRAEDVEQFEPEIDFLAAQTDHIDLAFLQWVGPDEDDNEVRQFVERFDPRAVLVLSPDRREDLFPEMADRLRAWGFEGEIFTAANAGDEFVFKRR
jgi:serine/threonine-protein phosphatase 6 regulatory ankyrin repeat subunit B